MVQVVLFEGAQLIGGRKAIDCVGWELPMRLSSNRVMIICLPNAGIMAKK